MMMPMIKAVNQNLNQRLSLTLHISEGLMMIYEIVCSLWIVAWGAALVWVGAKAKWEAES